VKSDFLSAEEQENKFNMSWVIAPAPEDLQTIKR
jgi:hypothetical protein